MNREGVFIGDVARQTGLSIHTIRFYETERVLPELPRTQSGYRVYSPQKIENLEFIKKAQELGFSLKEIRELLVLRAHNTQACSHVRSLCQEKLETVRAKCRELQAMEEELRRSLKDCERRLRRHDPGSEKDCPVLAKLGRHG